MFERLREDIQSVFHRDPAARNAFDGIVPVWTQAPPTSGSRSTSATAAPSLAAAIAAR